MMHSKEFQRIEKIYFQVLDLEPELREPSLRKLCGDDTATFERVIDLLNHDSRENSLVDRPPDDVAAEVLSQIAEQDFSGQELFGYEILEKIGEGGMGDVYLARDTRLGRKLAVKFLNLQAVNAKTALRRFEREARTASSLNHPNIVTVYEIGESDDIHYIATELIEGVTLQKMMGSGALDIRETVDIAMQIAKALDAAHRAGVIHRDIKAGNIMIRPDGVAKVVDFGIAKLFSTGKLQSDSFSNSSDTRSGLIVGTTMYMSPEQARGSAVDARTDIFSFGVLLYAMLFGKMPFQGETATDIISSIVTEDPDFEGNIEVPEELSAIVKTALKKEPDKRYQSAAEILEDLYSFWRKAAVSDEYESTFTGDGSSRRPVTGPLGFRTDETYDKPTKADNIGPSVPPGGNLARWLSVTALGILALAVAGIIYQQGIFQTVPGNRSIAVLPIKNLTGEKDFEFVADGLTESLISSLSDAKNISVKSRSSVFSFKGSDTSPQTAGRQLSADTLLTGEITSQGDLNKLNVGLIDIASGDRSWTREYTFGSMEIATLQWRISSDLIDHLGLGLMPHANERTNGSFTGNADAFRHYLRGRYHWNKRTPMGFREAIEEFKQAVDSEPSFALAYVGLADSYMLLENYSGFGSFDSLARAKAYAKKALEIDDSLAEAHATMGNIYQRSWEWERAGKELRAAISLKPNYAPAHHWYSLHLRETGHFRESLVEAKVAAELDPLSGIVIANLAGAYLSLNDVDAATELLEKSIKTDPSYPWTRFMMALAEVKKGNLTEAVFQSKTGWELAPRSVNAISIHGFVLAKAARRQEAKEIAERLEKSFDKRSSSGRNIARVYAGLGDNDAVFEWLEKDFENHSAFLSYICWTPMFDSIREDPRFEDIMRRMGIESLSR